jgi:hypothetical protein
VIQIGELSLCIDYRSVNARTNVNSYVMPRSDYILSQLGKAKYFTVVDLAQGCHQLLMKHEDRHKTAFVTPHRGAFQYKRLPFGLKGACFTFQKKIDKVFHSLVYNHVMAFLDDCIIYSGKMILSM